LTTTYNFLKSAICNKWIKDFLMRKTFSIIAVCAILTGCGTAYRVAPITGTKDSTQVWGEYPHPIPDTLLNPFHKVQPDVLLNPYEYNPTSTNKNEPSLYYRASHPKDSELTNAICDATMARNQLQNAMLRISDESTALYLAKVKAAENNGNLFLGAATLGLSGGASVAGSATAKALAAAATGTGGARELFNDQIFRNALVETMVAAIEADRAQFKQQIISNQSQPIYKYDVEAAIQDANEYHLKGSFYHGLDLIRSAAESDSHDILQMQQKLAVASQIKDILNTMPTNSAGQSNILDQVNKAQSLSLDDLNNLLIKAKTLSPTSQ
jgi:hypothetical protein